VSLIAQFFTAPDDGNHAEISTEPTHSRSNIMGHKAQMNIKHVGSIASIHREVDEYMRGQVTSHRALKFSPQRTNNPAVALEWEARVQELHAKTQVFHKTPRKTRKYDLQEKAKLLEMAYYFNAYGAPF
jgi:hypothetical protein